MEEQLKFFLKSIETQNKLLNGELYELSKSYWITHSLFIKHYLKDFRDIIVYKGFWSGYEIYEKPYYRFISDVDFFVSNENYKKLREFFLDLKFNYYYIFPDKIVFYKNFLCFEIHKRILPIYYIQIDSKKLLKRAINWKFNLLTFPIEEHFIISLLHFHKSAKKIIYWLWDIFILYSLVDLNKVKEVCKFYDIDYDRIIEIFNEIKMGNFLRQNIFFKKSLKNYVIYFFVKFIQKISSKRE